MHSFFAKSANSSIIFQYDVGLKELNFATAIERISNKLFICLFSLLLALLFVLLGNEEMEEGTD